MKLSQTIITKVCGWSVVVMCLVVLSGWQFNILTFRSILPEAPQTTPLTTFMLLALGVALIISEKNLHGKISYEWVSRVTSSIAIIVAVWTGLQYIFNLEPSVELVFFSDLVREQSNIYPGRPSPHTAISVILVGLSIFISTTSRQSLMKISMTLCGLGFILPWIAMFGYVSASNLFYAIPGNPETGMSPITAGILILLIIGILGLWPQEGVFKLLRSSTAGGKMARMLLPFALIFPFFLGWTVIRSKTSEFFSSPLGFAFAWGLLSLIFAALTIWIGFVLQKYSTRLQQAKHSYQQLIETVQDYAIFKLDVNGNIQSWNAGAEKIKGYSADEIIGKNTEIFYTEEDRQKDLPRQILDQAKERGHAATLGWRVRKDGSLFWADVVITALRSEYGDLIGFSKVTKDITERKKAHERFKNLLESAPDPTVVVNEQGKIQFVNAQIEKYFGFQPDEIIGKRVEALIPERFNGVHQHHRNGYFQQPKSRQMGEEGMELFGRKKDGTEFPVEVSLSPLRTEEGLLVSAAIRDITERKKTEAEIKQYNLELESKNRELEQFAYVASHDLQEPLSTVSSFVELLDKQYKDSLDEKGNTYLRFVKESADRMRNLVTALLAYSRLGRDRKLEEVDCNQLVEDVLSDLDASIKSRKAEIVVSKLPVLKAYPTELKILLQNLVGNAIKFVAPDTQPKVTIDAKKKAKFWEFSVCDNGIGIKEEFRERIFVIFQRLHNISDYKGTGIGLAQCKKIVELHGGNIWVESNPGEGSCFYFKIPVA